MNIRILSLSTSVLLLCLAFVPAASAQQAPAQAAPSSAISDADLQAFVQVQPQLEAIRTQYASKMQAVTDQSEATTLQQQANAEMVGVLQNSNISVETFNQIAITLEQDTELRERIEQIME